MAVHKMVSWVVVRFMAVAIALALSSGCGGSKRENRGVTSVAVPSAPLNLTANVGTTDSSLGWDAPANSGGATVLGYDVAVAPAIAPANIVITGRRALLRNLSVGATYSVTVHARNSAGTGPATAALSITTRAASVMSYQVLNIAGDVSPSGIFDPSILRVANGDLWLSYSSVNYYNNASNQLVQDVGIRLARSTNGGASFDYVTTIATPGNATVTDTAGLTACGLSTCQGRWVYETSWLIDDSTDPNPARRFKLFAHKYFLSPGRVPATYYHLGSIVMWTASAPDASWSAESSLLGWNLTPPELTPLRIVNSIHTDLAPCISIAEGSASVRGGTLDFVFSCVYPGANPLPQKIVMLRSLDHANTFQYVSTLLTPADATPIGASHYSAPSILAVPGAAPVLLATPVVGGIYSGCVAIPISDDGSGQLFRSNSLPVGLLYMPVLNVFGGACAYERGLGLRGILLSNVIPGATAAGSQFRIYATHMVLQP